MANTAGSEGLAITTFGNIATRGSVVAFERNAYRCREGEYGLDLDDTHAVREKRIHPDRMDVIRTYCVHYERHVHIRTTPLTHRCKELHVSLDENAVQKLPSLGDTISYHRKVYLRHYVS